MLHYHLYDLAPDFDFLTSEPPHELKDLFGDQLIRARALLTHRTPAQIDYAIDCLDWILLGTGELLEAHSEQVAEREGECYVSRVKALKLMRNEFEITDQESLPNATWTDYFAVLSIAYVSEFIHELNMANRLANGQSIPGQIHLVSSSNYFESVNHMYAEWALECMDAVCYAEHLKQEYEWLAELEERTQIDPASVQRDIMSERGRKGGRKKAARFDSLRKRVLRLHDEHYAHTSARNAATQIYFKHMMSDIDAVLRTDDPVKQLEKWIGKDRRQKKAEKAGKTVQPST